MIKKRNRKKYRIRPGRLLLIVTAIVAVPLSARLLWNFAAMLGKAGENAAILSALIAMPEGGVPLIQERFRAEIYNPEGQHSAGEEQGVPLTEAEPPTDNVPDEPEPEQDIAPSPEPPRIPSQYAAPILSENFSGRENPAMVQIGAGLLKNETSHEDEAVAALLETPFAIEFEETGQPQVLIVHTHATEAFEKYDAELYDSRNTWRSTDNNNNMVTVGDAFTRVLEENGIVALHDTTQHDYPSYNGSYERSAETIRSYLETYPSIKVVLDLHRDAMQREDAIVKPVAVIDGKKAAQIMIISACDDGDMNIPEWRENLRFAAALQNQMESDYPGLTRPIYFCYRKYNMDLTTGSLLLEFGSNANTLEEAVYSATMAAQSLADLIRENTTRPEDIDTETDIETETDADTEIDETENGM